MKESLKKKWVAALRSGRYRQGYGRLQTWDGSNCCLGVLCRVAHLKFDKSQLDLSYDQFEKCGLRARTQKKLITMNDLERMTFEEIASYISRNL
jgi:hypothetical protein